MSMGDGKGEVKPMLGLDRWKDSAGIREPWPIRTAECEVSVDRERSGRRGRTGCVRCCARTRYTSEKSRTSKEGGWCTIVQIEDR